MVKPILSIIAIIVTTAMIAILVGFLVSKEEKSYKYEIVDGNGRHFKTKAYTKNADGCITFQKECGCGGEELETVVLCGTYTIEENKDYNPHAK